MFILPPPFPFPSISTIVFHQAISLLCCFLSVHLLLLVILYIGAFYFPIYFTEHNPQRPIHFPPKGMSLSSLMAEEYSMDAIFIFLAVLMIYLWVNAQEYYMQCGRSNTGQLHMRQAPYLLNSFLDLRHFLYLDLSVCVTQR